MVTSQASVVILLPGFDPVASPNPCWYGDDGIWPWGPVKINALWLVSSKGKSLQEGKFPHPRDGARHATTPKWRRDVQPEENATSIRHLLNHRDSCFAHVDSFRWMKRTSFTVSDLDGWDKMQARRFLPERAYSQFWLGRNSGDPEKTCLLTKLCSKRRKFEVLENPQISKIDHIRQNVYDAHEKLYKRYGRMAKPAEEATNARLASVWIVKWVIFLRTKRKERRLGKISLLCKPKLRVNRLRVIRIR